MNPDELKRELHISKLEKNLFSGKVDCLKSIKLGREGKKEYISTTILNTNDEGGRLKMQLSRVRLSPFSSPHFPHGVPQQAFRQVSLLLEGWEDVIWKDTHEGKPSKCSQASHAFSPGNRSPC